MVRIKEIRKKVKFNVNEINKLEKKELQISVHGRVGVGKSSLLNALIEKQIFPTDIINGNTKTSKSYKWEKRFQGLNKVLRVLKNGNWDSIALTGGFAEVESNEDTVLVNKAEMGKNIDSGKAEAELEQAKNQLVMNEKSKILNLAIHNSNSI